MQPAAAQEADSGAGVKNSPGFFLVFGALRVYVYMFICFLNP